MSEFLRKIWLIIMYDEIGPRDVWGFDEEWKAREFGKGLVMNKKLNGFKWRIGQVEIQ